MVVGNLRVCNMQRVFSPRAQDTESTEADLAEAMTAWEGQGVEQKRWRGSRAV